MSKIDEIREAAEADLLTFIRLVAPHRVLGACHEELCHWWTREGAKSHQLALLPRDHQKSAMVAYRVAWWITKHPDARVLYISSTSTLAEKQLKAIKDILTSDKYRFYWPDHVHPDENKREKWTNSEICLDHPKRKEEGVRDSTVFTAGLTTSITGLHSDINVLDDVVVFENAYTNEGRNKVQSQYSLLSSIQSPDSQEWVVGTRYHPKDLYSDMLDMAAEIYNDEGEVIGKEEIYEVFQKEVESKGDGTGEFLWPRQQRKDGKWFGFDRNILAQKRGKYLDRTQFYAQYYNNPNNPEALAVTRDKFQYYSTNHLTNSGGVWYYKGRKLNIFASIDFAYSKKAKADYTAIVVVGVAASGDYYVLDIDRFKTDKVSEYFKHIRDLLIKWNFKKLRAETTAAQKTIVQTLKDEYIKPYGLSLKIEEFSPSRYQGSKAERIAAVLEPRYENQSIWHYKGGNCQTLEEELMLDNPPHDDVKDALASAIEIAVPPKPQLLGNGNITPINYHPKFGGIL